MTSARRHAGWILRAGLAVALVLALHFSGLSRRAGLQPAIEDALARTIPTSASGTSGNVRVFAIDDLALEQVGEWVWGREVLATAIDELRRADASVVALDLLIDKPRWERDADPAIQAGPGERALADAIRAHGDVILAANFSGAPDDSGLAERRAATADAFAPTSALSSASGAPDWPDASSVRPPMDVLRVEGATLGNVTLLGARAPDGVLRRVPGAVSARGVAWPSLGVAAATRHLGASASVDGGRVVVDGADGGLAIDQRGMHRLVWPHARAGWTGQLDTPTDDPGVQIPGVVSIRMLLTPSALEREAQGIITLLAWASRELLDYPNGDDALRRDVFTLASEPDEVVLEQVRAFCQACADEARIGIELFENPEDLTELSDADRQYVRTLRAFAERGETLADQLVAMGRRIQEHRTSIRALAADQICFIGWVATAAAADVHPTAIDNATPGVVIHALVADAMLRDASISTPGWPARAAWIALLGLTGAFFGAQRRLVIALLGILLTVLTSLTLAIAAWGNAWLLPAVDPALATLSAGGVVLLGRLVSEQRARQHTERRFRSYVPPEVVDLLVADDRPNVLVPRETELTVLFADIVGFTQIAERLDPAETGVWLNGVMSRLTATLHEHGATLDKYLGDGLMAFWNAPIEHDDHAERACNAAIAILEAGATLEDVALRVGVATGRGMVGDFGDPPRRSSYTVIGDVANTAARLEQGGRLLGTSLLINHDAWSRAGSPDGWIELGPVRLKGRAEPERILTRLHGPDWPEDRQEALRTIARGFCDGDAAATGSAIARFEQAYGTCSLIGAYTEALALNRDTLDLSDG